MSYNAVTIQQYLRGLLREILPDETLSFDYSFTSFQLLLHFYFPQRMGNPSYSQRKLLDNSVGLNFFSSFYVSVDFPMDFHSNDDVLSIEKALKNFFGYSSFTRQIHFPTHLNEFHNNLHQRLQYEKLTFTNDNFSIEIYVNDSKNTLPFQLVLLNKGWYVDAPATNLESFPFLNYHLYFEDGKLLSDFTEKTIHTIVISSHTKSYDLFDFTSSDERHESYHYVYGYFNHRVNPNIVLFLKEEIMNEIHLLLQKFMLIELNHSNQLHQRNQFESINNTNLVQLISECVSDVNEKNPIDHQIIDHCAITPTLLKEQIEQNILINIHSQRIDNM